MGTRTILLSLFALLFVGCAFQQNVDYVDPCGSYRLLYEDNPLSSPILKILEDGTFCLEQENQGLSLNIIKTEQKGIWTKNGSSLFLTSYFQDKISDYLVLQGDQVSLDSIQLTCLFLSDGLICNDGFILFLDTVAYISDSNGFLSFPCELKSDVEKALIESIYFEKTLHNSSSLEILVDTTILQCGKRYLFYIKDCSLWKMNKEKFEVRDSCLHNVQYNEDYRRLRATSEDQ